MTFLRIIKSLSGDDRGLVKERIKNLDKRIQPGFNKLTWTKWQAAEEFITTCRKHASELQNTVDKYKSSLMQCFRYCKQISELLLVRIDTRKIFEHLDFGEDQLRHRRTVSVNLTELYESIETTLQTTHEIFKKDESDEVKREWNKVISQSKINMNSLEEKIKSRSSKLKLE